MERTPRSGCPIGYLLDIVGDRWSLLIVRDLLFKQRSTFSDFAEAEEGIATNTLADRLRRLEGAGIITKTVDKDNRRSYVYALTKKGRDLGPMLAEMIAWGGKHDPKSPVPKKTVRAIKRDREAFLKRFR